MDRRRRRRARADPRAPWSNPRPSSTSARWRSHAPVEFLASRSSYGPPSQKEDAMKYMLLIHQGITPLPGTPEWEALSDEEKGAVYADYQAINETPGAVPGRADAAARDGDHGPRPGRPDADHGRPVRRHHGGHRRLPVPRGRRP